MIRVLGVAAAALAVSATPALAAKPKITVAFPASPGAAQVSVFTAKLSPARNGVRLSLQQQAGSRWKTIASARTSRKGVAILAARLAAGTSRLRVSGRTGNRTVTSATRALTVGSGGGGGAPLFDPPGRDLSGQEAADRIVPYLSNSTFTDCIPGFPGCAVEYRYGFFANATMFYCRLTNNSGSDIINGAQPFQIIGAEMKADGSWGVSLQVASYGNIVFYNWEVSTAGVAYGAYWGPGSDPRTQPASQAIGPLQWVRGARDCSY